MFFFRTDMAYYVCILDKLSEGQGESAHNLSVRRAPEKYENFFPLQIICANIEKWKHHFHVPVYIQHTVICIYV